MREGGGGKHAERVTLDTVKHFYFHDKPPLFFFFFCKLLSFVTSHLLGL